MATEKRALGRSGIQVCALGLGVMRLSLDVPDKPVDDQESIRIINMAIDEGIQVFDTHAVYGDGRNEELLGQAIAGWLIWGVPMAMHQSGVRSTLQSVVAPEMQGRFWTIRASLYAAIGPLAMAVAGPLADRVGVRPFWFAFAAGGLLIALIRRFTPALYYIEDHPGVERSAVE